MRQERSTSSVFVAAVKDPNTWVPAAAAVLLAATDSDHAISDWATEQTPIFGSQTAADNASDHLRGLLATSAMVTSIVSPGNQQGLMSERPGNYATLASATITNSFLTSSLKDSSNRMRPNQSGDRSFPSSHTSAASSFATISSLRTQEFAISTGKKITLSNAYHGLAAATAWARVEAKAHYPTDVLIGYALGNLTTRLINEALLGPGSSVRVEVECEQQEAHCQMIIHMPF